MASLKQKKPQPGEHWEIADGRSVQVVRPISYTFFEVINPLGWLEMIDKKSFKWQYQNLGGQKNEHKQLPKFRAETSVR